jgi:hypothetical protein
MTNTQMIEPPHLICDICNDDGKCLNNEKNPKYDNDFFGSDYWDCVNYLEKKTDTVGETMKNYVKNLQKDKEEYESGFGKWNKQHTN